MPRQRKSSQMKYQDKVMIRDLSETGIINMSCGEFKATILRILAGLEKRMENFREMLTKR